MTNSTPHGDRTDQDHPRYVIGVDFGSLSGRAVVVRVNDGHELASAVYEYPHAVMDTALATTGQPLPPEWALQDAEDYIGVLRTAVPQAVRFAGIDPQQVIGIGTDFTACTMVPTLADGTPLSALDDLRSRPHAYVKLWKHHAAQPQADRINATARETGESWLARYGGLMSSEWEFAKGLQIFEEDREIYDRMQRWVEGADWIVWQLCGNYVRNACTAGYKGILQEGRYPGRDFLERLAPGFGGFVADKVEHPIGQLGDLAGVLTAQASAWTGLPEGIAVAVGNVDAHVSAPAARATEPGQMVAIMGTSTCHVMSYDRLVDVPGMCGVVQGGIVPGLYGYEAGQSGVGDIFAWFIANQVPHSYATAAAEHDQSVHEYLTDLVQDRPAGDSGLLALDWNNGNRSVLVDTHLSGLLVGQTLTTKPEEIYRALLESTAFGARVIVEAFADAGIPVTEFIVGGGLLRNAFLMQIYSNVLRMPISVTGSDQGPALGSAIHAAVACGAYPDIRAAAQHMGKLQRSAYVPDPAEADVYDRLFREYRALHDYFGRGGTTVMHQLKQLRRTRRATTAPDSAGSPSRHDSKEPALPMRN
jgi:L-ribulokinase